MSPVLIALAIVAALLALAMGSSGLAPSFGASLGAGVVKRRVAVAAYAGSLLLGAVLLGDRVASTLGGSIAPAGAFTPAVTLAVLASVAIAMLAATLLSIPQSTSWVTVAAIVVVGLDHGAVSLDTLYTRLLPAWLLLPLVSYGLVWLVMRRLYPLRPANMRLHEHLRRWRPRLRWLVMAGGCYVAFAIGSNNVGNVIGPLSAAGAVDTSLGLWLAAPMFGLGGALLPGPADTMGRGIVPLGEVTAATASVVVGTLLLMASLFGVPQSLVQLQAAAVLAISRVKEESVERMPRGQIAKIGAVWLGAPLLAAALTRAALEVAR